MQTELLDPPNWFPSPTSPARPGPTEMERAFYAKDASFDGLFYTAVRTTGIFCRPSCPATPLRENVEFFPTLREAHFAGYRPCKRCRPEEAAGAPAEWVARLEAALEREPDLPVDRALLSRCGVTPEQARRWFQTHRGMTLAEWVRARRLARAFTQIRNGQPLSDVALDNGWTSPSGFQEAFAKTFGVTPSKAEAGGFIAAQLIESPLGPLLACATDDGAVLLEFTDRRMLPTSYQAVRDEFDLPVLPTPNQHTTALAEELRRYFAGALQEFRTPIVMRGTAGQRRTWEELRRIPYGETVSYAELAHRVGNDNAMRAVARANGANCIGIVIPCHRVIGKDGTLTGYGGGLWRKRLLLELERTGRLPS